MNELSKDIKWVICVIAGGAVVTTYLITSVLEKTKPVVHEHNYNTRLGLLALAKETNVICMECQVCKECGQVRVKP